MIATACLVPDLFVVAFAKVFYEFFLQRASGEECGGGGERV